MHHLVNIIEKASDEVQILLFALTLLISWNIENIVGLTTNYRKWKHAFLNASFIFSNLPFQFLLGIAFAKTMHWTGIHHFGLLYHLPGMTHHWLLFIVAFVFLDLGEYVYHLLMHKIKGLWMFHVVHHTDRVVDVSTTLREHPGENLIRNSFTLLWVFISGTMFWVLLLRQIIQTFSNVFAHINYRLPEKVDKVISTVFITSNLHHVHHHYQQPYTDCNYGDVLSIWDRLFGTFGRLSKSDVVFGVDTYMDKNENARYLSLLKLPFGKYRKSNHNC